MDPRDRVSLGERNLGGRADQLARAEARDQKGRECDQVAPFDANGEAGATWRAEPASFDEISATYKDFDQVMENASDLVEVKHILKQFID
jgi:hypothetical protein